MKQCNSNDHKWISAEPRPKRFTDKNYLKIYDIECHLCGVKTKGQYKLKPYANVKELTPVWRAG